MADPPSRDGLRKLKRRETRYWIAQAGLNLILQQSFETTTVDAIAAAAGVSRRTFFHYFDAKEDILLVWQEEFCDALRATLLERPSDEALAETVYHAVLSIGSSLATQDAATIDRLVRSTGALRARKQVSFIIYEQALFEGLCERSPQPEHRELLRFTAMVGIGAMRLALDEWDRAGGQKPYTTYLQAQFAYIIGPDLL